MIIGHKIAKIQNHNLRFETSERSGRKDIALAIIPEIRINTRLTITATVYAEAVETAAKSTLIVYI